MITQMRDSQAKKYSKELILALQRVKVAAFTKYQLNRNLHCKPLCNRNSKRKRRKVVIPQAQNYFVKRIFTSLQPNRAAPASQVCSKRLN